MSFVPAICPQCSAPLQLGQGATSTVCEHCRTPLVFAPAAENAAALGHLLTTAEMALKGQNYGLAHESFRAALLLDTSNPRAWHGLGYAAAMQSNLVVYRFAELRAADEQAVKAAQPQELEALRHEFALDALRAARQYFDSSLEHTLKFIGVREAQFEHADRTRAAIELSEYALSLDPGLTTSKAFIHDIASRCETITYLDQDTKRFFTQAKARHAAHAAPKASAGASVDAKYVALILAVLVFNYLITSTVLGVENPIAAFFVTLLLLVPEVLIGAWGLIGFLKLKQR